MVRCLMSALPLRVQSWLGETTEEGERAAVLLSGVPLPLAVTQVACEGDTRKNSRPLICARSIGLIYHSWSYLV